MARVKTVVAGRARRKRTMRAARGFWGGRHRLYQTARVAVERSWASAYRDRRRRKRDFRRLWITRVNAAARLHGVTYRALMHGLRKAGVEIDRKMLADLAVQDPRAFQKLAEVAKGA